MMKQSARFAGFAGRALLAGRYDVFVRGAVLVVISLALRGSAALAGGSAENALLLVDPRRDDSLYIANYYRAARDLPDRNLLYVDPAAPNYATFVNINHAALFGTLANAAIEDHIDYIIIAPGGAFYIPASGYVSDNCRPVNRFALSAAYTIPFIASEVLTGVPSTTPNHYANSNAEAYAFRSAQGWYFGSPSSQSFARRYFLGAQLGYLGERGNTVGQILALIDRSVAVDGTRPTGTFYYMRTTDPFRSPPRDPYYAYMVGQIQSIGGQAELIDAVLPTGRYDCLGIMTGWADPIILTAELGIRPGAICDHLTSYAGTFDIADQTKMSEWITKGASGSWGTVEEPCNYPGKFPHARMYYIYYQGLSLGEALFRSVAYVPFQGLLYGDPLTRPFAYFPTVAVNDAPAGPVGGVVRLTPTGQATAPGAQLAGFDLLVDGVLRGTATPGGQFTLDTRTLADGWHDLRVLAYDNTLMRNTGRWRGSLVVNNRGRGATLTPSATSGNLATPFHLTLGWSGGAVCGLRVVQNGRVVATTGGTNLTVHGRVLGAGPVRLQAEALFRDGSLVRSAPVALNVAYDPGTPAGPAPVAFHYRKRVRPDQPFVVELPATYDGTIADHTYALVQNPAKATIEAGAPGPYRLMRPSAGAKGLDRFTFQVTGPGGASNVATVTIDFGVKPGDLNCDGQVNFNDINPFVQLLADPAGWQSAYPTCAWENGDINCDNVVDFADINPFVDLLL